MITVSVCFRYVSQAVWFTDILVCRASFVGLDGQCPQVQHPLLCTTSMDLLLVPSLVWQLLRLQMASSKHRG